MHEIECGGDIILGISCQKCDFSSYAPMFFDKISVGLTIFAKLTLIRLIVQIYRHLILVVLTRELSFQKLVAFKHYGSNRGEPVFARLRYTFRNEIRAVREVPLPRSCKVRNKTIIFKYNKTCTSQRVLKSLYSSIIL